MESVKVAGEWVDSSWEQVLPHVYNYSVGDVFIGQVFDLGDNTWSCVGFETPHHVYPVHGFSTKESAAEFMLKLSKYGDFFNGRLDDGESTNKGKPEETLD